LASFYSIALEKGIRELMIIGAQAQSESGEKPPATIFEKWTLSSASCTVPGILVACDDADPSSLSSPPK